MKKLCPVLLLILSLIASAMTVNAGGLSYDPGYNWIVDNITYGVSVPMNISNWSYGSHCISFNGIGFNVTCANPLSINFSFIRSFPKSTTNGEMILNFTTSNPGCLYTINLSGLRSSYNYTVQNASTLRYKQIMSSATGKVQWRYVLSSARTFVFYDRPLPVNVSSPSPSNASTGIPVLVPLRISIMDPSGFPFNWTISTTPTIGNSLGNIEGNGTKTCAITSFHQMTYNWTVSALNPSGIWVNRTYHFTTEPPAYGGGPTIQYYVLIVTVVDKNNLVVENATVTIAGNSLKTNAHGMAVFQKQLGTYKVTVSKSGYATVEQNIVLNADKAITIKLDGQQKGIFGIPENQTIFLFVLAAFICFSIVRLRKKKV